MKGDCIISTSARAPAALSLSKSEFRRKKKEEEEEEEEEGAEDRLDRLPQMMHCCMALCSPRCLPHSPNAIKIRAGGGKMYGSVVMEAWRDSESWRKCLHHTGREIIMPLCTVLWEEDGERGLGRVGGEIKHVTTVARVIDGRGRRR